MPPVGHRAAGHWRPDMRLRMQDRVRRSLLDPKIDDAHRADSAKCEQAACATSIWDVKHSCTGARAFSLASGTHTKIQAPGLAMDRGLLAPELSRRGGRRQRLKGA